MYIFPSELYLYFKKTVCGGGGVFWWLSWASKLLVLAQVVISGVCDRALCEA